jgi:hypothetical protein
VTAATPWSPIRAELVAGRPILVVLPPDFLGRECLHEMGAADLILLLANHYLLSSGQAATRLPWYPFPRKPARDDRSTSQERKPRP